MAQGRGCTDFIQSRRPVSVALWYGDMGGYPQHGTGTGGFPRTCGMLNDGVASTAEFGRNMGAHLGGGGERGGRVRSDRNLHPEKVEYGRTVYCNIADYGPV